MIRGMEHLPWKERLKHLGLSWGKGRLKGELIEVYEVMDGI